MSSILYVAFRFNIRNLVLALTARHVRRATLKYYTEIVETLADDSDETVHELW